MGISRILPNLTETSNLFSYWNANDCDYPVENVYLYNDSASDKEFIHIEIIGCKLEKNKFIGCNFDRSSFVDVIFEHCDFSNSQFEGAYFQRCEFVDCKFIGCKLIDCSFKNCDMRESIFSFANLSSSLFEDVVFDNSDFTDSVLSEIKHKRWKASGTKFIRTSFFRTKLKGFNFSECELLDFIISDSMDEIKGAKISPVQAMEVAKIAGAVIF